MSADVDVRAALAAGDLGVLGALYDEHGAYVYGLAIEVTGSRTTAEEVTQDVFTALWERPLSYDPELGSIRGWLASRALHEAAVRVKAG
ncbi:hypothetical protein HII36_37855 [Nonomuraea sp. NN258]|uniref:sigma factor n=1 Tax=Nonomuraea antri TaxID=2730852 RepID=UPI00156801C5|nr:sigma factor [Nonomuraea antri]NRQ37555.1 hypothetical protein [Nonomuraea antri]